MKKIIKISVFFVFFLIMVVIISFPLALGKGNANTNSSNRSVVNVVIKGDFAFPYENPNVGIARAIIDESQGSYRHNGIDYNGGYGTKILAINDGYIYKMSQTCAPAGGYLGNWCPFDEVAGGGNYVVLQFEYEGKQIYVIYAHLSDVYVKTGQIVKKGDVIGAEGHSGNSTGSHLHLEVHYGGIYAGSFMNLIDPSVWFRGGKQ